MTQTLNNELLDGQRKLLAIAASGASSKAPSLLSQLSNGPLGALHEKVYSFLLLFLVCCVMFKEKIFYVLYFYLTITYLFQLEVPPDPTQELSRLMAERKYEEAFTSALQMSDVNIVSWLCSQVISLLSFTCLNISNTYCFDSHDTLRTWVQRNGFGPWFKHDEPELLDYTLHEYRNTE